MILNRPTTPTRILAIFLILLSCIISVPTSAYAARRNEIGPVQDSSKTPTSYIVVDASKGTILASKNIHEARNVASVSKIITALAAISTLPADQLIDVPPEAKTVQPMKMGLNPGEKWKRDDLLYCLMLVSANDAAYALAAASSGSIPKFATQQNRIAEELGMKDSTFGDPSGLDDDFAISGDTKMSAYDLAIAGRAVLANGQLATMVGTKTYQFTGGDSLPHTLTNHNDTFLDEYPGANGMKTGYTKKAGRTMMASATRDGVTLLAVVLNVQQTDEWAAQLLDQGFAKAKDKNIAKGTPKLPAIGSIGTKANLTILNDAPSPKAVATKRALEAGSSFSEKLISVPFISFLILLGLAVAFVVRRRAVTKRKKLRRQQAAARERARRKMLHVIDDTIEATSELVSKK